VSIAWTTVENALHAWAVAGSGLATAQVIWALQRGPRPTSAYIALRLTSIARIGHDWLDVLDVDDPDPGEEIEHRARGMRDVAFSVQAFGGIDGAATGATSPVALLEGMVAAVRLPSVRSALQAAKVGVGAIGPVQSLDGLLGRADQEPRALVEMRLHLPSELSDLGTYIEYVELNNQTTGSITWVPEEPSP